MLRREGNILNVYRRKKGFVLLNVIIVLFVILLIGSLSINFILGNRRRQYIELENEDLNKLHFNNDYISFINSKLNGSEGLIEELFNNKEVIVNENKISKVNYNEGNDTINITIRESVGDSVIQCRYKYEGELLIIILKNQVYSME